MKSVRVKKRPKRTSVMAAIYCYGVRRLDNKLFASRACMARSKLFNLLSVERTERPNSTILQLVRAVWNERLERS